jgi:hypothetical protein
VLYRVGVAEKLMSMLAVSGSLAATLGVVCNDQ